MICLFIIHTEMPNLTTGTMRSYQWFSINDNSTTYTCSKRYHNDIFASFAGAWGSIRLAKRLRPKRMIIIVSVLTLAGSVLAALFDYIAEPGFLLLLIAPVLYSLGMALLRPVMMAMNLDYFPKNRGMAAAIQQFFVTASFCFSAAVWVPIVMGSAWKYALASAFCAFLVLALWLVSMRLRPEALKRAGVPETMR